MIGTQVGQYRIIEKISSGGSGMLFLGVHVEMQRRAAVKFLLPDREDDEDARYRFLEEAQTASQLDPQGVVQVFDFGATHDGRLYIVMELLEGEDHSHHLRRRLQHLRGSHRLCRHHHKEKSPRGGHHMHPDR